MKNFFQDNEQDLVAFLRQNRPLPPREKHHLESQVMNLINQAPQKNSQENYFKLITALSGTLVLSLVVTWTNNRWQQPAPQMAVDQDMVETFLINSWNNTINDKTVFFTTNEQEAEWFFPNLEKNPQVLSHSQ